MASENKTTAVSQPKPTEPPKPSLSDVQARDNLIAVSLGQIVAWQMAEGKINHDLAGTYAVRYANSAMAVRASEAARLNWVVTKGIASIPVELPPPTPPAPVEGEKPKSIAEIIGEAPPVQEIPA